MICFPSLFKSPLSWAILLPFVLSACTTTQAEKDLKSHPIHITSSPPGASVVVSDNQAGQERRYTSPATLEVRQGYGRVRISKDGYWQEERFIFIDLIFKEDRRNAADYVATVLGSGVVGLFLEGTGPKNQRIETGWLVHDITQTMIRGWKRPADGRAAPVAAEQPEAITGDLLQVQLKPIPPVLLPFLAAAEKNPARGKEESLAELQALYDQEKITREEFVRAQMRLRDLRRMRQGPPAD
jgi:hypothetical protein